jgi:Arc/MetJ family transcription regulator
MAYTTICVKPETKKLLQEIGVKRETYDEIIRRLVREAGWKKLDERWNRILEEDEFISLDEL